MKLVWVSRKIIHVNDVKANTRRPNTKRVSGKKIQYIVSENKKKKNTKNLKENTFKVYNSSNNTKILKKKNTSQVFYPKRKKEVAYKKG